MDNLNGLLVSIKYRGTKIVFSNSKFFKNKNRPIKLSDFLLTDLYYTPIYKILDGNPKFGYHRFTYCEDGTLYHDFGADEFKGVIDNQITGIESTNELIDLINSKNYTGIIRYFGFEEISHKIGKIYFENSGGRESIENIKPISTSQNINNNLLSLDILNCLKPDMVCDKDFDKDFDNYLCRCSIDLFNEYIKSSQFSISTIIEQQSLVPPHMKNTDAYEKLARLNMGFEFTNTIKDEPDLYYIYTFILSMFKREFVVSNPLLKNYHIGIWNSIKQKMLDNYRNINAYDI